MSKIKYYTTLFSANPYKRVNVNNKSLIGRLFCEHQYNYLVKSDNDSFYFTINGDDISYVCLKCGKVKFNTFWEYEGMGYK